MKGLGFVAVVPGPKHLRNVFAAHVALLDGNKEVGLWGSPPPTPHVHQAKMMFKTKKKKEKKKTKKN